MKKLLILIILLVCFLFTMTPVSGQDITDFSGYWVGQWNSSQFPGENGEATMTITQDGSDLTVITTATDTDCGDIIINMAGQVQEEEARISGSFFCVAWAEYISNLILSENRLSGNYAIYINDETFDSGILILIEQEPDPPSDSEGGCFMSVTSE